jgi:hypothetical protein
MAVFKLLQLVELRMGGWSIAPSDDQIAYPTHLACQRPGQRSQTNATYGAILMARTTVQISHAPPTLANVAKTAKSNVRAIAPFGN